MNKKIEEYIQKRKEELASEKEQEKINLLFQLGLAKVRREYQRNHPGEPLAAFPYQNANGAHYRIVGNCEEISDEEYQELLKYAPQEKKEKKKISGWYLYGQIMMILGGLGGLIMAAAADDGSQAIAGIGLILGSITLFSQIILLAKIEYNTRKTK